MLVHGAGRDIESVPDLYPQDRFFDIPYIIYWEWRWEKNRAFISSTGVELNYGSVQIG